MVKRIRIQQHGIRGSDAGGWTWFVGDHAVGSKAEGSKIGQGFICITERN
jgi:N-acetylglucosamine kinase-like BadF-type ATPase